MGYTKSESDKHRVVIVGGGFAGLSTANFLARNTQFNITVIDRRSTCPDVFRAEKLEPDQIELLKKLGMLDFRSPNTAPIGLVRYRSVEQSRTGTLADITRLQRLPPCNRW